MSVLYDFIGRATNSLECRKPNCRGQLVPLVDGIPILIDEAISVFSISDFTSRRDTFFPARSKLVQLLRRLIEHQPEPESP